MNKTEIEREFCLLHFPLRKGTKLEPRERRSFSQTVITQDAKAIINLWVTRDNHFPIFAKRTLCSPNPPSPPSPRCELALSPWFARPPPLTSASRLRPRDSAAAGSLGYKEFCLLLFLQRTLYCECYVPSFPIRLE